MDFLRMCLVLSLCMTLMAQAILSAPVYSDDVELADFLPELKADLALVRERRDVMGETGDDVAGAGTDFLTRIRRQVAQMASGRRGYTGGRRYRSRGRLHGRRRYNTRRVSRTRGRVVDW